MAAITSTNQAGERTSSANSNNNNKSDSMDATHDSGASPARKSKHSHEITTVKTAPAAKSGPRTSRRKRAALAGANSLAERRPNDAALAVLTDLGMLQSVTAFASGVPHFVFLVKQQLECLRAPGGDSDGSGGTAQTSATAANNASTEEVPPADVELWQRAVLEGDRRTLEALFVLANRPSLSEKLCRVLRGVVGFACTRLPTKDMALLEWLDTDEFYPDDPVITRITEDQEGEIGEQGDIELVQWLWRREYEFGSALTLGAARGGHVELVRLLHESEDHSFGFESYAIAEAAKHGHLSVILYIHEHRHSEVSMTESARYNLLDAPAAAGDLEMVRYIHEHGVGRGTEQAVTGAANGGHLEVVRYLLEHDLAYGGGQALDKAAEGGHLEIAQALVEFGAVARCPNAIDKAIERGHAALATFLYAERGQRSSGKAMEAAMRSGDVGLLEAFADLAGDAALQHALLAAADMGSTRFMRMLFTRVGAENCRLPREDLVNRAASAGNLQLLRFFHEHDAYFRFSAQTMHYAATANQLAVVRFLLEHRTEGCRVETLFECDRRQHARVLDILCTQRPMRAPQSEKAAVRARREGRMLLAAMLERGSRAATTYGYKQ